MTGSAARIGRLTAAVYVGAPTVRLIRDGGGGQASPGIVALVTTPAPLDKKLREAAARDRAHLSAPHAAHASLSRTRGPRRGHGHLEPLAGHPGGGPGATGGWRRRHHARAGRPVPQRSGSIPTTPTLFALVLAGHALKALLLLANRQVGYTVAHVATSLRLSSSARCSPRGGPTTSTSPSAPSPTRWRWRPRWRPTPITTASRSWRCSCRPSCSPRSRVWCRGRRSAGGVATDRHHVDARLVRMSRQAGKRQNKRARAADPLDRHLAGREAAQGDGPRALDHAGAGR